MRIDGQVALVSGGGSGLGAAAATMLAECGARVAVLDFDGDKANAVAQAIDGIAAPVDVGDCDQVGRAVADAMAQFGQPPRIVVNCAGIAWAARIVDRDGNLSVDLFERVVRVNLTGSYIVMSHAVKAMLADDTHKGEERGVIINTASAAWQDGQVGQSAYAASKGAIASMCLPAARELARFGVRVNAIAPGLFNTPMMAGLPAETTARITADIQFPNRLGAPKEFALLACQIIENPYLNGTTVRLDGAVRLPPR